MIIVLLITMLIKRYVGISWIALSFLSLVIWFLVLNLLVRWRPDRIVDDE